MLLIIAGFILFGLWCSIILMVLVGHYAIQNRRRNELAKTEPHENRARVVSKEQLKYKNVVSGYKYIFELEDLNRISICVQREKDPLLVPNDSGMLNYIIDGNTYVLLRFDRQ